MMDENISTNQRKNKDQQKNTISSARRNGILFSNDYAGKKFDEPDVYQMGSTAIDFEPTKSYAKI